MLLLVYSIILKYIIQNESFVLGSFFRYKFHALIYSSLLLIKKTEKRLLISSKVRIMS